MGSKFQVHSVHHTTVPVTSTAQVDGRAISVQGWLPALIVELVPLAQYQRSYTHVVPIDTDEAKVKALALYRQGVTLEMGEFSPGKDA